MKKFRTFYKGTMYYSHSEGYPGYLELYNGEWEILIMYESGDHGERIGVDEKDVEQCVGGDDKRVAEIYENDICEATWGYCYPRKVINLEDIFWNMGECMISDDIVTLGNIHENPSLLDADARGEDCDCPVAGFTVTHKRSCEHWKVEP